MSISPKIAFIGAGHIAYSLIAGLCKSNPDLASYIIATNPTEEKLKVLEMQFGISTTTHNEEAVKKSDIIILCVKPKQIKGVLFELTNYWKKKHLLISLAAGIRIHQLSEWASNNRLAIIRAMPNTPAVINKGTTALYANVWVKKSHKKTAEAIFKAVGITVWLAKEEELNIVTAVSGCGPAYFFLLMNTLIEEGIKGGLTPEAARSLVLHTALGSIHLSFEKEFSILIQELGTQGSCTEVALETLLQQKVPDAFSKAVLAAERRAIELSQEYEYECDRT